MGPCQGRQCAQAVGHIIAEASGKTVAETGHYRERPPVISDLSRLHPINRVLGGARNYVESPVHRMMGLGLVTVGIYVANNLLT